MRLIARYSSLSAAEERAAFLRSRGIATHVTELSVLKPSPCGGQVDRAAVWAMLAPQYEDARLLLEDADYRPGHALDEGAMQNFQEQGQAAARRVMMRGLILALLILGGLLAVVLHLNL